MPAIILILVAGALLRLVRLSAESLWIDEAWSAWHVSGSLGDLLTRLLTLDNHPPLAHLLQWPLGGATEFAVRLPSALVGILAIPLAFVVVRRFLGARAGLVAAALIAISPFAIHVSRDARHYSLLLTLSLLAVHLLLRLRERPTAGRAAALAVAAALMLHTQYVGALFLLPLFVAGLRPRGPARRFVVLAGLGGVLLTLPWLFLAREHFLGVAREFWLPPTGLADLGRALGAVSVLGPWPGLFPWPAAVLLALPWAIAAALGVSRLRECPAARLGLWLFAAPLALLLLVCLARPLLLPRTVVFLIPPLVLLALAGMEKLRRPGLGAAVLLLSLLPGTVLIHALNGKEDWRGAVAATAARIRPGEPVLIDSFLRKAYDFYAPRHPELREAEVVELPPRESIPDLDAWLSARRAAIPLSFWLLLRTCDEEDVRTRDAARAGRRIDGRRERNHVETVRFTR